MEKALGEVPERHAKDAGGNAEVHDRIVQRLHETHQQAGIVKGLRRGARWIGVGWPDGVCHVVWCRPRNDEQVPARHHGQERDRRHSAVHFEIASYRALIAAAEELGEASVTAKLRGILVQELSMAQLKNHLAGTVREHLHIAWAARDQRRLSGLPHNYSDVI